MPSLKRICGVSGALLALCLTLPIAADDYAELLALGEATFTDNCRKCHQLDGYGEESLYPSLHRTDLLANRGLLIQTILHGRVAPPESEDGEVQRLMPELGFLTNGEIVAVIAFITRSWGGDVLIVSAEEVQTAR